MSTMSPLSFWNKWKIALNWDSYVPHLCHSEIRVVYFTLVWQQHWGQWLLLLVDHIFLLSFLAIMLFKSICFPPPLQKIPWYYAIYGALFEGKWPRNWWYRRQGFIEHWHFLSYSLWSPPYQALSSSASPHLPASLHNCLLSLISLIFYHK